MSTGARSQPPDLPNFEYRSWLGGGGFADVFLYDQLRPQRQVAVKVLRAGSLDAEGLRAFDAEANLMAKVSAHPYIVSIYGADVAPDGRPFLVMEYYAKPNFGQRARGAGLAVQEVLRVGVRVASAVETAHRAGILHRDIKPANILVNDYDRPGLTDFGIAGASDGSGAAEAQGVTVAYAPPEVLEDESAQGDELGDVYSLAATLYALLAGRSPFEVKHGDNTAQALLQRTLNAGVSRIDRADVPRSLELLLSQAMDKAKAHRPGSASALARALQGIERELQLAPTDFELATIEGVTTAPTSLDDVDSTRAGRIQVVRPTGAAAARAPISEVPTGMTQVRGAVEPAVSRASSAPAAPAASETVARDRASASVEPGPTIPPPTGSTRRNAAIAGGVVLAIVVALVIAVSQLGGGGDGPNTTVVDDDALVAKDLPATPIDVAVVVEGTQVIITWDAPGAKDGDWYTVTRLDVDPPIDVADDVTTLTVTISDVDPTALLCFEVTAKREGAATLAASREACAR